ncbi:MAG: hypothetical protein AB8B83_06760 [Bdellovibrionales bacterium]
MASQDPAPVDEKELEHLQKLWLNFGVWSKWVIGFSVFVLIALAIAFLP